jgi:hypothetical protein
MYQNPSFETWLIILFLVSLTLLYILTTIELINIQKQSGTSLRDEDPEFIDFFRP